MRRHPIELVKGDLHVPESGLWLDARRRMECTFVSHAHGDHIARHDRVIATRETLALMKERLGDVTAKRRTRKSGVAPAPAPDQPAVLPARYGEKFGLGDLELELFSAGHVLGSAQLRVSRGGFSLCYTGDFCTEPTLTAAPAEVVECDVLVMESTFGLPRYAFPPKEETLLRVAKFCDDAASDGATPVLLAYSLGKAQEILKYLGEKGYKCRAHPSVAAINRVYSELGVALPNVTPLDHEAPLPGEVVVAPPHLQRSTVMWKIARRRTAVLTGWAMDDGGRLKYRGVDASFPLSDHADFPSLVRYAKATKAKKVFTLHGFAEELAHALDEQGVRAEPLRAQRQLELL